MEVLFRVILRRQKASTPWGFRLSGGKDFKEPLVLLEVFPNSIADNCGLQKGDRLIVLAGHVTENMNHKETQEIIFRAGNVLEIIIHRPNLFPKSSESEKTSTSTKRIQPQLTSIMTTPVQEEIKHDRLPLRFSHFLNTSSPFEQNQTEGNKEKLENSETKDQHIIPQSLLSKFAQTGKIVVPMIPKSYLGKKDMMLRLHEPIEVHRRYFSPPPSWTDFQRNKIDLMNPAMSSSFNEDNHTEKSTQILENTLRLTKQAFGDRAGYQTNYSLPKPYNKNETFYTTQLTRRHPFVTSPTFLHEDYCKDRKVRFAEPIESDVIELDPLSSRASSIDLGSLERDAFPSFYSFISDETKESNLLDNFDISAGISSVLELSEKLDKIEKEKLQENRALFRDEVHSTFASNHCKPLPMSSETAHWSPDLAQMSFLEHNQHRTNTNIKDKPTLYSPGYHGDTFNFYSPSNPQRHLDPQDIETSSRPASLHSFTHKQEQETSLNKNLPLDHVLEKPSVHGLGINQTALQNVRGISGGIEDRLPPGLLAMLDRPFAEKVMSWSRPKNLEESATYKLLKELENEN